MWTMMDFAWNFFTNVANYTIHVCNALAHKRAFSRPSNLQLFRKWILNASALMSPETAVLSIHHNKTFQKYEMCRCPYWKYCVPLNNGQVQRNSLLICIIVYLILSHTLEWWHHLKYCSVTSLKGSRCVKLRKVNQQNGLRYIIVSQCTVQKHKGRVKGLP
jgi:hypothetical protein